MSAPSILQRAARLLKEVGVPYAIMGGQAVIQLGDPRLTRDVDALIDADHSIVQAFVKASLDYGFRAAVPDPDEFVRRTAVLVLNDVKSAMHLDVVFGWTPYEHGAIERAITIEIEGVPARFLSPEDLILHKLFASRSKDLEDAKGILLRQRGKLDLKYLRHWLPQLAEVAEEPGLTQNFEKMLEQYYFPKNG